VQTCALPILPLATARRDAASTGGSRPACERGRRGPAGRTAGGSADAAPTAQRRRRWRGSAPLHRSRRSGPSLLTALRTTSTPRFRQQVGARVLLRLELAEALERFARPLVEVGRHDHLHLG